MADSQITDLTASPNDPYERAAQTYATSRPGLFAVGDVRSGSVKRVAAGVGEGSVVIHSVHQFLNPDLA